MGLASYIVRRLLLIIPILLGTTFITFFISRVTVPDPARAWAGVHATPQAIAALAVRFHLKDPLYVQYVYYLRDLVTGNWGVSPTSGRPVLYDLQLFFPATAELADRGDNNHDHYRHPYRGNRRDVSKQKIDHSIRLIYLAGFSSPPFFVALLFLFVFSYYFNIFPTNGQLSSSLIPPARHTGMYIVDSLITGNWVDLKDSLWHIVMPATALALTYFGIVTRIMRSSMLEVFRKDFIRASYAKGLGARTVVLRHAVRNAMIPTTTVLGLLLGSLLGGTIVIETIFLWPGIGYYATQSIESLGFSLRHGDNSSIHAGCCFCESCSGHPVRYNRSSNQGLNSS